MRNLMTMLAALAAAMLALGAAPAAAQQKIDPPAGDWIHAATGTHFPRALPPYTRGNINQYTPDGTDASVSYSLVRDGGRFLVTVYIHPMPEGGTCEGAFDAMKRSTTEATPVAQLVSETRVASPSGKARGMGYLAHYRIPKDGLAPGVEEVFSDAYMFCSRDNEWLVSYRATWSATVDFSPDAVRVLNAIAWPAPLGE